MRKLFIKARDFLDDGLRRMCGRLTPEKRVIAIVVMAVVFAGLIVLCGILGISNGAVAGQGLIKPFSRFA